MNQKTLFIFVLIGIITALFWTVLNRTEAPSSVDAHPIQSQPPVEINPESKPKPELSGSFQEVLSEERLTKMERSIAFRALAPTMRNEEIHAVFEYIQSPVSDVEGPLHALAEASMRNEWLNALELLDPMPDGLEATLIRSYHQPGQALVMRDYAIQHLASWCEGVGRTELDQHQTEVLALFENALEEVDSQLAGTALLCLHRIKPYIPELTSKSISERALHLLRTHGVHRMSLTTALGLVNDISAQDARELFETFALDENQPVAVRMVAIRSLGTLGAQIEDLESLCEHKDRRIQNAAKGMLVKRQAADA